MRVREIVGDTQSAEIQQMRRSFNSLLRVLENIASQVGGTLADSEEAFTVLEAVIVSGLDADGSGIGAYVGTNNEVVGIRPTPRSFRKAQANARVVEDDGLDA